MVSIDSATDIERDLVTAFATFGPAFKRWVESHTRAEGLTIPRIRLLHALLQRGPRIMRELGSELCISPRGVTGLVDGLEAGGLVRRRPHPTDRRATIVELTDEGRSALQERYDRYAGQSAALFARLDRNDQRELLRIIRDLTRMLEEMD